MTEKVVGSNPHCEDHFSCTIHLDQIMEAKIDWKLTNVAYALILQKGGWTFRMVGL